MGNAAQLDELAIKTIRGLSMDAVQAANSGHPGTPMALAPLGWAVVLTGWSSIATGMMLGKLEKAYADRVGGTRIGGPHRWRIHRPAN